MNYEGRERTKVSRALCLDTFLYEAPEKLMTASSLAAVGS